MQFSLIIRTRPQDTVHWQQALRFAETATQMGHSIRQCFFQSEGVLAATHPEAYEDWCRVAESTGAELLLCSQAAEAYEITANNPFVIGGLGALVEAGVRADRVISFV